MPERLSIGAYRHRVAILQRTWQDTPDGRLETWQQTAVRWAAVEPLSARVRAEYQQLASEVSHRFRFRGRVLLKVGNHRLVWQGVTYEVAEPAIDPDGLGRETVVVARRLPAA